MLYGTRLNKTLSAASIVPADASADISGSFFSVGDPILVRPLWTGIYKDAHAWHAVLLTYAVPNQPHWKPMTPGDEPFSCHACSPLVGLAVFRWSMGRWRREIAQGAVLIAGGWGRPPSPIRLIKVGPQRFAAEVSDEYQGNGRTIELENFVAFTETAILKALRVEVEADDAGECTHHASPEGPPACYRYRRTLHFVAGSNVDFYDLQAILHGTDFDDGPSWGAHAVSGSEVFRVQGGSYVRIERKGPITSWERSMEESQHLD